MEPAQGCSPGSARGTDPRLAGVMSALLPRLAAGLLVAVPLLAGSSACATASTRAQSEPRARSGSVLPYAPTAAWSATARVFQGLGGASARLEAERARASMTWSGTQVVAELQPHTSGGTIVRLGAARDGQDSPATVDAVLGEIQRVLLATGRR